MSGPYVPTTQKGAYFNAVGWVLAISILVALVAGGAILVKTVFAEPAGQAGAYRQKVSAANRVQSQALFESLASEYEAAVANIAAFGPPSTPMQETELRGLRQHCVDVAQQFNAESRKYTARDWKSAGLPERLDLVACHA